MRILTLSTLAVVAAIGVSAAAHAQAPAVRTTPPGKLFFEGDIVRHALEGQVGPFCVLQNQYKRGEAVAWRIRVMTPDGAAATNTVLRSVEVELGNGQRLPARYGGHGNPPTDFFWSLFWTIPDNFPTGSLGYKVHATMMDGSVVTWEPFNRATTQLMVIPGEPLRTTPAAQP